MSRISRRALLRDGALVLGLAAATACRRSLTTLPLPAPTVVPNPTPSTATPAPPSPPATLAPPTTTPPVPSATALDTGNLPLTLSATPLPPASPLPTPQPPSPAAAAPTATVAPRAVPTRSPPPAQTPTSPVRGEVLLRIAPGALPRSLDPLMNDAPSPALAAIHDPWLFWAPDGDRVWGARGALVESWAFGQRSLTLWLRRGVTFHDGTAWDAEVARWNWGRLLTTTQPLLVDALSAVDRQRPATIVDARTLRISLTRDDGSVLWALASPAAAPVSRAAFEKLGGPGYAARPVGVGPFRVDEATAGERVRLSRYPGYWRREVSATNVAGIEFGVPAVLAAAVDRVRTGEIDGAELATPGPGPLSAASDPVALASPVAATSYRLALNAVAGPFRANHRLRQAATLALDPAALLQAMGALADDIQRSALLPGTLGHDPSLSAQGFNPAQAAGLVKEAGYSGGVDVLLLLPARAPETKLAEAIRSQWAAVGIRAILDPRPAVDVAFLAANRSAYHAALVRAACDVGDPGPQLAPILARTGDAGIVAPDLDETLAQARRTIDSGERAALYRRAQEIDLLLSHHIYLLARRPRWLWRRSVQGLTPHYTGLWGFAGVSLGP
ncbi:MAG: ABC transporter substrate-binding protein [Chloroflexi bacterium]|nr:ABC transporter substrate-binding protein [Chloroflexota bacterium]